MNNLVLFPDIDWINHHTHDFKFHYRFGRNYFDLVLDTFRKELNGKDMMPHLFEKKEYRDAGSVVCARQGVEDKGVSVSVGDHSDCYGYGQMLPGQKGSESNPNAGLQAIQTLSSHHVSVQARAPFRGSKHSKPRDQKR